MSLGSKRIVSEAMAPLIDLVFPPRCAACGDLIGQQSGLCQTCWSGLEFPEAIPSKETEQGRNHATDANGGLGLRYVYAATFYNDVSKKIVLPYKHGGRISLASLMARMMAASIPDTAGTILIPVPLHRWRLWRRGYNQAALLAQALDKFGKGRPMIDAMVRSRATPPLGGRGRAERAQLLHRAVAVNPRRAEELRGADILIVDDVITSGATVKACAEALSLVEPRSISCVCFARTRV